MPFKKLRTENLSQEIVTQIKKSIFGGTYEPGDKLPSERDLAEKFGVSNITVRQAVRVLENSGILNTRVGASGGIFVADADTIAVSSYLSDMLKLKRVTLSDLTMTRLIFEPDIASLVSQSWKDQDLDIIYENIKKAESIYKEGDLAQTRLVNLTFHRHISSITRNPVIMFTINSVINVLEENIVTIQLGKDFVLKEIKAHMNILKTIESRDIDAAREAMQSHISTVHKQLAASQV